MEYKKKKHQKILSQIQSCIEKGDHFLITTHKRVDGDAIASTLIFADLLERLGKKHWILIDDQIPHKFEFVNRIDKIIPYDKLGTIDPQILVILDASNLDRIGRVRKFITSGSTVINMDHHPGNEKFGTYNLVDTEESSTVELVYYLYSCFDIPFNKDTATTIFMGIMSDTGRFRFPNTTYRSFMVCAEMVKLGVSPCDVAEQLYYNHTPETQLALAAALSSLEFHYDGTVSCMHLQNSRMGSNNLVDTEGFVDYLLQIKGTKVEFFMLEEKKDSFRVSFRSKCEVDVNEVAKQFGGGGHKRASGCYVQGKLPDVKKKILDVIKGYMG